MGEVILHCLWADMQASSAFLIYSSRFSNVPIVLLTFALFRPKNFSLDSKPAHSVQSPLA